MGFHLGLLALAAPPLPQQVTVTRWGCRVGTVAGGPAWHRHRVCHPSPSLGSQLWVEAQPSIWDATLASSPCSGWHSSASSG